MAKAKAKRTQARHGQYGARSARAYPQPRWTHATVRLRWYAKTARWPDADNAIGSVKGAIDGLVDAGVLLDDDNLTWLPIERHKDKARPEGNPHQTDRSLIVVDEDERRRNPIAASPSRRCTPCTPVVSPASGPWKNQCDKQLWSTGTSEDRREPGCYEIRSPHRTLSPSSGLPRYAKT